MEDSSTLPDRTFSTIWLMSPEKKWQDLHEDFATDRPIFLDNEISVKFWKSFGPAVRIHTPDTDS